MEITHQGSVQRTPWNKGKLVGQKAPLRLREIWAIRIRLQLAERTRELALFNLAVDSRLRSCDLVRLRVRDVRRFSPRTPRLTPPPRNCPLFPPPDHAFDHA